MKVFFPLVPVILGAILLNSCQNPSVSSLDIVQPVTSSRNALSNTTPVILESARLQYQKSSSGNWQARLTGLADLKNLAYGKSLILHYSVGNSTTPGNGQWTDIPGTFRSVDSYGYEQWKFETPWLPLNEILNFKFALKYTVNGNVFWDNNSGKDYLVQVGIGFNTGAIYNMNHGVLNNGPVVLDQVKGTFNGSSYGFYFHVLVKNLSFTKTVKVVYTVNNWATQGVLSGTYNSSLENGVELWTFPGLILPTGVKRVKFALSYDVNGITYWDNNQGANYTFDFDSAEL